MNPPSHADASRDQQVERAPVMFLFAHCRYDKVNGQTKAVNHHNLRHVDVVMSMPAVCVASRCSMLGEVIREVVGSNPVCGKSVSPLFVMSRITLMPMMPCVYGQLVSTMLVGFCRISHRWH